MFTLTITFDTQSFSREGYEQIVKNGQLLGASGVLNLRWEEFSALDAARQVNLHPVIWETTRDDTPGSLTCIIHYENVALPEVEKHLQNWPVIEYQIYDETRLTSRAD